MAKLKGNVDSYLIALEDEIERVKHQRSQVPFSHREHLKSWDEYIAHLENLRVEACLLMEFEEPDDGRMSNDIVEVIMLKDEEDETEE